MKPPEESKEEAGAEIIKARMKSMVEHMDQFGVIKDDRTEILLMNPTSKNLRIKVNENSFKLTKGEVRLIKIDKEIIKIASKCYFIRPIIFSYKNEYLDVYHG